MDRWSITAWLCMVLCAFVFFTYEGEEKRSAESLQQEIAAEIIRFHVRANSDSEEDQALKLLVKEELVEYMGELLCDVHDKQEARRILEDNIENIENVAKGVIREQKKEYNVEAYFENSYFPIKTYADMTFPAGIYEAFRVDIGAAEGKNWWCVVYPKLCFVDVSYGVMPKEAKDELEAVLDEDELKLLYENSAGDSYSDSEDETEYVYEFKIFRFLNKLFK
ncbi:MAG: stage II sporulation protein R [Lachnospiraceae bacterium]